MMNSQAKSRKFFHILVCFLVLFILWMPGLSSVSVPHANYQRIGYGIFSYYAIDSVGGKIVHHGILITNLVTTVVLSFSVLVLAAIGIRGATGEGEGPAHRNRDGGSKQAGQQ